MILTGPLNFEKARIVDVTLTPTAKFFKPVLVVNAPCDRERAEILGCEWLFDVAGNPHHFEGSVKPEGELAQALVSMSGTLLAPCEVLTEKVAHFRLSRVEKKGVVLQLRVHLPEQEPEALLSLLQFLSSLNKGEFEMQLTAAQPGLPFPAGDKPAAGGIPQPDAEGRFDVNLASVRPFSNKGVTGSVATLEIEGGFIGGWHARMSGKTQEVGGSELTVASFRFNSESEALEAAVAMAREFAGAQLALLGESDKGRKPIVEFIDWLFNLVPQTAVPA